MKSISISDSQAVFGKNECIYQRVLDDFKNSTFIGIMTFNISPNKDSRLLSALKNACLNGANAIIVTNIPQRFETYFYIKNIEAARAKIDLYRRQLDPRDYGMRLNPYFTFHNHAKIIMTDNMIYWGSSNFSDESQKNFECGSISTDKELINYVKDSLFSDIESQHEAVPYYKYNYAIAIVNLNGLIQICKEAKKSLFYATFEPWKDYDTNFEEKWICSTPDSKQSVEFLGEFIERFSQFDDALNVIDEIVDEYCGLDNLPEPVDMLKSLVKNYKKTLDNFYDTISSLRRELEQVAKYDLSREACRRIETEYTMEAYDENLDYYMKKAMEEVNEEYRGIIENAKQTVRNALNYLSAMIRYFKQLKASLYQLLEFNPSIDNTNVE